MEPGKGEKVGHTGFLKGFLFLGGEEAPASQKEGAQQSPSFFRKPKEEASQGLPGASGPKKEPSFALGEDFHPVRPKEAMDSAAGQILPPTFRLGNAVSSEKLHPLPGINEKILGTVGQKAHAQIFQFHREGEPFCRGLREVHHHAFAFPKEGKLGLEFGPVLHGSNRGDPQEQSGQPKPWYPSSPSGEEQEGKGDDQSPRASWPQVPQGQAKGFSHKAALPKRPKDADDPEHHRCSEERDA